MRILCFNRQKKTQPPKVIKMSLSDEIFEWRKQFIEKLILSGAKPEGVEGQTDAAQALIYKDCIVTATIECPIEFVEELNTILLDFSQKNGCLVIAKASY